MIVTERASGARGARNSYFWLGLSLTVVGAVLSPVFYFIVGSVPLTALGVSFVMLGLTSVALANTRPPLSPEASQMMLRVGIENTAALLEELGLSNRAVYLPQSWREGRSQAVVPLRPDQLQQAVKRTVVGSLIVRHGTGPLDMGVAVTTPGSICFDALAVRPGPEAGDIEAALSHILIGMLDMADAVSVVVDLDRVRVEVRRPKLGHDNLWYHRALGSPLASIAATVTCEAYDKPVVVMEDEVRGGKGVVELGVLG